MAREANRRPEPPRRSNWRRCRNSVLPPSKPVERELAPQKPDLKLPVDAIRAGRSGAKPLSEHIKKHEQKRKAEGRPGDRGGPGGPPIPQVPPTEETGRERSRRGPRPAAAKAAGSPDEFATSLGGREARQLIRKRTATPARSPAWAKMKSRSSRIAAL